MDSERIVINFDKICRACMTENGEMTSVFNTSDTDDIRIVDMLESCSSLHIEEGDGLPVQICIVCYDLIHQSYNFKNQCNKSDAIMRTYLKESIDNKAVKLEETMEEDYINNDDDKNLIEEMTDNHDDMMLEVRTEEIDEENISLKYELNVSYNCMKCNEFFMSTEELEKHETSCDNPVKMRHCPKCFKKFKYDDTLQIHFAHCSSHECNVCNKKFRTAGFLQNHMKKHDSNLVTSEKRFKCTECDKAYTSPANLTIHQYSHTGIKPYKCEYCSRGFTKLIALNSHLAIHTGQRSHLCSECGRGFTSASILNQHKKIHTGERPFKCSECPKSFTASGDLTIHMRSHTGEKPYLCPTCGRAFARITHLNTHIRTHTGEKPYICQECGRGFAQSGDLRSHIRTHTGERPYVCSICNKSFIQSSGLSSHMATHSGVKLHVCGICSRAFSQASSLARHLKGHT